MKHSTHLLAGTLLSCLLISACDPFKNSKSKSSSAPSQSSPEQSISPSGVPSELTLELCVDANDDFKCDDELQPPNKFNPSQDPAAKTLARLAPLDDIGVSEFSQFEGMRYLSLPAFERTISASNALAYGLYLYAKDKGDDWCGPCKMARPTSYLEAKKVLAQEFKLIGTDGQNQVIMASLNRNLELFGNQGLELATAYYADIKAMAEALVNLTVRLQQSPDLSGLAPIRVHGRVIGSSLPREASIPNPPCNLDPLNPCDDDQEDMTLLFALPESQAATLAYQARAKEKEDGGEDDTTSLDIALDDLICANNQIKQVFVYGINDNFDNSNPEPTAPSASLAGSVAHYASYLHGYDFAASINNRSFFAETLTGLPTDASAGLFIVGLREQGYVVGTAVNYTDSYTIGSGLLSSNIYGQVQDLRANWQRDGDVYFNQLSNITNSSNQSLLDHLNSGQSDIDISFSITTNVDFIAVGTCRDAPEPDGLLIEDVIEQANIEFTCPSGTDYLQVSGGLADDFASPVDNTTPSSAIALNNTVLYDQPSVATIFADSLALPNNLITKAQLIINARSLSANGTDSLVIFGDSVSNIYSVFGTMNSGLPEINTANNGVAYIANHNMPTASGILLDVLNSGIAHLDIAAYDQIEVDMTLLQMCVKQSNGCLDSDGDGFCDDFETDHGSDPFNPDSTPVDLDGDGHNNDVDCDENDPLVWDDCEIIDDSCAAKVSVDLRPASSWLYSATNAAPVENNVFSTYPPNPAWANVIWDGAMNWFDFGSAGNTTHTLTLDFCSCGGGEIIVDEMKSDNYSHVYLDDSSIAANSIVQRTVHNQSTMASWGSSVNGVKTFPASSPDTDHTLFFEVKNVFGPSGGSINGTLDFYGHLGACAP